MEYFLTEVQYFSLFYNASVLIKGHFYSFRKLCLNLVAMATCFELSEKEVRISKLR